ncbi:aconitase X swivel domain-containing protein [Candidatus Omnitrophota bacterium]
MAKGKAKGEALVFHEPFCFVEGVNPETGVIIEKNHEYEGNSVTGKVLVFPTEKGSTGSSFFLYEMARRKTQPSGIINLRSDPVLAVGAIISGIPVVDKLDGNPVELIKSGDYVELYADEGFVKVQRST